eukprot:scaffold57416_cov60-Phaeocystis_antarctica.AAC.2
MCRNDATAERSAPAADRRLTGYSAYGAFVYREYTETAYSSCLTRTLQSSTGSSQSPLLAM